MKENKKKNTEIVCLGNNCRSAMAEAILKDEAKNMNIEDLIEITSSGRYVTTRHPFKMLTDTMKKVIDNNLMNIYGNELDIVKQILQDPKTEEKYANDPEFREKFLYYFDQVYRPLQAMDIALRNNVLARHGLKYESPRYQFPSKKGLDYVLTATRNLVEPVKELVTDTKTIVTSLGEFTGTDDIKGGFGKFDINYYEGLYKGMREIAPVVLEKVLEGK